MLAMIMASLAFAEVTLISPPNNCYFYDPSPLFDWADVTGATEYRIQVDDTFDFGSPIINMTADTSEFQHTSDLPETLYFWRVIITTPPGETSAVWQFYAQTKGPDLIAPRPDTTITDRTPTFCWFELTGASVYQLVVTPSGSVFPVIDTIISDTTFTPAQALALGDYSWFTQAKDSFDYWSVPSEAWAFTIFEVLPAIPVLIAPENLSSVTTMPQTLIWSASDGAVSYNLICGGLDINLSDTFYVGDFPRGINSWKVRAENEFGSFSDFSSQWSFSVLLPAWVEKESMPSGTNPKKKNVKDGGALVAVGNDFYALRGNKSRELYKYDGTAWTSTNALESMPFGYKPDKPDKLNKKEVGKGASLCYDGDSLIYATKGNGTREFWAYNIYTDAWVLKGFVPAVKGLKGGTSIVYYDGKVYVLAGGQKPAYKNFFSYNTADGNWDSLKFAPLNTGKPYKDGSCITLVGDVIYCLQAGANENYFSAYHIANDSWVAKEYIPLIHINTPKKKTKVKDGAAMTSDGAVIYAIKGGKVNEFWKYIPGTPGIWDGLESIPRRMVNPKYNKISMPKTGAALACNPSGSVYLLKGNGTNEFWKYYPSQSLMLERTASNPNPSIQNQPARNKTSTLLNLIPNPISKNTQIAYTITNPGIVSIKLYNADGRLVNTIKNAHHATGTYQINLSAQSLAKGIYFLSLTTALEQATTKLVIE